MSAIKATQADRTRWEITDDGEVIAIATSEQQANQLVTRLQTLEDIKTKIHDCGFLGDLGSGDGWEALCEIEQLLVEKGLYEPVPDPEGDEEDGNDEDET